MPLCSQKFSWFTVRLSVEKSQQPGTGFLKVSASIQRSNRLLLLRPYYQVSFEEIPKLLTIYPLSFYLVCEVHICVWSQVPVHVCLGSENKG